ncbi:hypothetical protein DLJ53_31360 [Acuticoccus sediminis]|uniref:Uncharacterized protein n=1 Tax=Acuticoccus sediminis TaxID=2184697 RepID=A0A8B2NMR0_9HYPH|nr:hypothetical protein [Acuticoccus sediminis]RAH96763.1 hypothetical protein DLJ53_31360 [Acuticoccus sediminis]
MDAETSPPSFETDIKPLFLRFDRDQMLFIFDLWEIEDVRTHSRSIYARLKSGDMPCDRSWPEEHVALFRSWIKAGCPD